MKNRIVTTTDTFPRRPANKNRTWTPRLPFVLLLGWCAAALNAAAPPPLALHPDNPHHFLFRGQPTVLITSGEHYGALLNLDFDYAKYFATLAKDGLNLTRTFAGAYCEAPGAFNITRNTLAPLAGRFVCPWARSATPGYANGGNKFDLNRWDEAYFQRLRDLLTVAARHGVVVEMNLFCPFYEDSMWKLSPMNAANNVNGVGQVARTSVYTLDQHGGLLPVQEAMVRQIVTELKDFDNLYYEICNEPYFGGVTLAWQHRIADVIVAAEKGLGVRHLVSQNIANNKAKVANPHPAISIFNFHYASPPDTVAMNYALNKVIGDNETGFAGTNDFPYRREGWDFILAGGGLYNNLDYSFIAGHEDGTFVYPKSQPGGGNPAFRRQMGVLKEFIHRFEFVRMKPDPAVVAGGPGPGLSARVLAEPGRQYALYLCQSPKKTDPSPADGAAADRAGGKSVTLELNLPEGTYQVEWVNPLSGRTDQRETLTHNGGRARLRSPTFIEDMALRVAR